MYFPCHYHSAIFGFSFFVNNAVIPVFIYYCRMKFHFTRETNNFYDGTGEVAQWKRKRMCTLFSLQNKQRRLLRVGIRLLRVQCFAQQSALLTQHVTILPFGRLLQILQHFCLVIFPKNPFFTNSGVAVSLRHTWKV